MDTEQAFAMGQASRGARMRVFDWDRAARRIGQVRPARASAGLRNDWEWTGGLIWDDGKPVPRSATYTYLASTWAIPELDLDGTVEDCWTWMDHTSWDATTYWPQSALIALSEWEKVIGRIHPDDVSMREDGS